MLLATLPRPALPPEELPKKRTALVVAHPGHELRVHGFLAAARPRVSVLTDGAGRAGRPRLGSTRRVLDDVGSEHGRLFGVLSDRALYDALLAKDLALFVYLAEELAISLLLDRVERVVSDAAEGYNPAHDLCRLLVDAAVGLAAREGEAIESLDFPLVGPPSDCPPGLADRALWLALDDRAFARKRAAAEGYAELDDEVKAALSRDALDAFRVECLRPVAAPRAVPDDAAEVPFYETYGERQVAAGHYRSVIRRREHVLPVARALAARVAKGAL